jgi:hypothetical protein
MKKSLLAAACGLMFVTPTWAVPYLQLDIAGGVYDPVTQTTLATDDLFSLLALIDSSSTSYTAGGTYYLSAAITPKTPVSQSTSFGSFTINGVTYSLNSGMQWGNPPVDATMKNEDLASHGIYNTHYAEVSFTLDPSKTATSYNVQDNPGGLVTDANGALIFEDFDVDVAGLLDGYEVHFDLYTVISGETVMVDQFAPFSHDAQSGGSRQVPDGGATAGLLAFGLIGIQALRRKLAAR